MITNNYHFYFHHKTIQSYDIISYSLYKHEKIYRLSETSVGTSFWNSSTHHILRLNNQATHSCKIKYLIEPQNMSYFITISNSPISGIQNTRTLVNSELVHFRLERLCVDHNEPIIQVYDQLSHHYLRPSSTQFFDITVIIIIITIIIIIIIIIIIVIIIQFFYFTCINVKK